MVTTRSRATPGEAIDLPNNRTPRSTRKRPVSRTADWTPGADNTTPPPASSASSVPEEVQLLRQQHKAAASLPARFLRWCKLQYFRYGVLCGPYCFDFWEGIILSLLYLVILSLVAYGAYKNVSRLATYAADRLSR